MILILRLRASPLLLLTSLRESRISLVLDLTISSTYGTVGWVLAES